MSNSSTPAVRYSNPAVDASPSAQRFSWEYPVPVTPFWDGLEWVICAAFLRNFDSTELSTLPIDPANTSGLTDKERISLLVELLQNKLTHITAAGGEEVKGSKKWNSLLNSIGFLQHKLGLVKESGITIRTMVASEKEGSTHGIISKAAMARQLIDERNFAEAEELMRPACIEVDGPERKWKYSPQSVGYRRTLLEAIWKQGEERRKEAEELVEEIKELIEGMNGGKMEVYVESERETLEKLLGELKGV